MKHLLLVFSLLALSLQTTAQSTTASVNGRIVDSQGGGLIGATVQAVHTPTGTYYGTSAQNDGYYTLSNLRIGGPYVVTVSYLGYKTEEIGGIELKLGEKRSLNVLLAEDGETLDEVVVSARKNSIINSERTGAATQIGSEQLQSLPTITRSASDFTRLTPASDGNSFGGRNDQYNNFTLDGSVFNNPFGLDEATAGGQAGAQPISLDAIEQIQVNLAPYDVTQSGFTGAGVNAVTKSGTNELSGTVYGFFRNDDLTGSKVEGEDIFVPELSQLQTGISLGGPIIRDKLFFFANFELERRDDLGSNFLARRPGVTGNQVSRVEAADLDAISSALFDRYGYETGVYENYLHDTDNEKGLVKLDWNIARGHTLTATYNFLNATRQLPANRFALGNRGPDAQTLQFFNSGYEIANKIHSGIVEWNGIINDNLSNKLQVGFSNYEDFRTPFSTPFPSLLVQRDGTNYAVVGHEPFSINNRLDQNVLQFTNNLQYFLGKHNFTIGINFERFSFDNSFNLGSYPGVFGPVDGDAQNSPEAFVAAVNAGVFDDAVAAAQGTFDAQNEGGQNGYDGTGWSLAETNVGQLGLYLQDEINVTEDFNLTVGVRFDRPLYFDTDEKIEENIERACCENFDIEYFDEDNNPVQLDSRELPSTAFLVNPRLGFNWDVRSNQTLQLRGGTGLFSGRFPFVWIGNQVQNVDDFFFNTTSPDFEFPQVWRTNLGGDLAVGNGFTLTTDLIYTKDLNGMIVRNYGLRTPSATLPGVDDRPVYTEADRVQRFDFFAQGDVDQNAYVFTNTDVGRSINVSLEVKRNWTNGLYTSLGYNFLDAREASSIEAEISSDAYERNPALGNVNRAVLAPSLYGNRHRVVGSAYKTFTYGSSEQWETSLALFFQYAEGGRFSYTYNGDINRDGSRLNDLIYIPTDAELDQQAFVTDAQREAFRSFIEQDDYLSENRGDYQERYAILSPWYSNWDVRVAQRINLDAKRQVELTLDIINFGNLLNSDWGVRQNFTTNQPIGVSIQEDGAPLYSFDEATTNTFVNDFSLLSRWQMQLGARLRF